MQSKGDTTTTTTTTAEMNYSWGRGLAGKVKTPKLASTIIQVRVRSIHPKHVMQPLTKFILDS